MNKYKYVGEGAGVPGLPHEITDEQAEGLGVTELLTSAIANGSYAIVNNDASTALDEPPLRVARRKHKE